MSKGRATRWLGVAVALVLAGVWLLGHGTLNGPTRPTPRVTQQPHLYDVAGKYVIAQHGPVCGTVAAGDPVCQGARRVGAYIDDTTPNLGHWLGVALADPANRFVIRAVGPGSRRPVSCSWARVLCAKEWYPYESGFPVADWGKMPRYRAYILQKVFSISGAPVKAWQTTRLLSEARAFDPVLILLY